MKHEIPDIITKIERNRISRVKDRNNIEVLFELGYSEQEITEAIHEVDKEIEKNKQVIVEKRKLISRIVSFIAIISVPVLITLYYLFFPHLSIEETAQKYTDLYIFETALYNSVVSSLLSAAVIIIYYSIIVSIYRLFLTNKKNRLFRKLFNLTCHDFYIGWLRLFLFPVIIIINIITNYIISINSTKEYFTFWCWLIGPFAFLIFLLFIIIIIVSIKLVKTIILNPEDSYEI